MCTGRSLRQYADDAGIVPKSAEGLAKMMVVIVFKSSALTVSETTETMRPRTPHHAPWTSPLVIAAEGPRCRLATQFLYLGGLVNASADIMPDIK